MVAAAPIQPLAWELPYATGATLKKKKSKKKPTLKNPYVTLDKSTSHSGTHKMEASAVTQLMPQIETKLACTDGKRLRVKGI